MSNKNLVIWTQYRENYGAHAWDGAGECPQYWKNKGGGTYVYQNLTPKQEAKIAENGIPTLSKLINKEDDYFTEKIIDHAVMGAEVVVTNPWEYDSIYWLQYDKDSDKWFYSHRKELW